MMFIVTRSRYGFSVLNGADVVEQFGQVQDARAFAAGLCREAQDRGEPARWVDMAEAGDGPDDGAGRDGPEPCDVLVIGAGPAGLTAACYLARYRRRVIVVHDGTSRALRIPLTHNAPGFPGGVSGKELMARMEEQATLYGAEIRQDRIERLSRSGAGFRAQGGLAYQARSVVIATGIELNQVDLPHEQHERALEWHCLRYCPVCDGYEATGKAVGVIGSSARGAREALFLRQYTGDLTLMPQAAAELTAEQRSELAAAGVKIVDTPVAELAPAEGGMTVRFRDGGETRFDVVYPALGCTPRADLIRQVGLTLTEDGCISDSDAQAGGLAGLFAAGDIVEGLDQISVAVGHGAIVATKAHNYLRELEGRVLHG